MSYTFVLSDGTEIKKVKRPNGEDFIELTDENMPEIIAFFISHFLEKEVVEIRKEEK